jgi:FkbM family methyltransferase
MILDVGAFNGVDADELSKACDSDIHCFEPYPASFEQIKLLRNERLIQWNFALGGFNGVIPMHIAKGHAQSNSIRYPKKHKKIWPDIKFKSTVNIQIYTLDGWFKSWQAKNPECTYIDFIWLDTNGSEADFLVGGAQTLKLTKYLLIEYCEVELYDNAMNREATIKALPGFEVIGDYGFKGNFGDLLLKSKNEELWTDL